MRAEIAVAKAAEADGPQFVRAALEPVAACAPEVRSTPAAKEPGSIEIVVGEASVRVQGRIDARSLAVVFKALRMAS